MTFCIGIRVDSGLVALADTQILRGEQVSRKIKLTQLRTGERSVFLMTSGLRSIRDKTVKRIEERIAAMRRPFRQVHELATAFGEELRRVRFEDESSLTAGGFTFNLNAIIGGQLADDPDGTLLQVFPEGNWVDATVDAPWFIIGRSYYGKPLLDQLLRHDTNLKSALALAYLAFDATRASVVDVAFPIDVVIHRNGEFRMRQSRLQADELMAAQVAWQASLERALATLTTAWAEPLWSDGFGDVRSPGD